MANKYSFFYDNGTEGGLSLVHFETESEDEAWEKWREFDDLACLEVRLVLLNMNVKSICFQE